MIGQNFLDEMIMQCLPYCSIRWSDFFRLWVEKFVSSVKNQVILLVFALQMILIPTQIMILNMMKMKFGKMLLFSHIDLSVFFSCECHCPRYICELSPDHEFMPLGLCVLSIFDACSSPTLNLKVNKGYLTNQRVNQLIRTILSMLFSYLLGRCNCSMFIIGWIKRICPSGSWSADSKNICTS